MPDKKPNPSGKVADYIDGLRTTPEKRYATKEWRRLAGQRATRATPFDLTSARANTIRDNLAAITGVSKAAPAAKRKRAAKGTGKRARKSKAA